MYVLSSEPRRGIHPPSGVWGSEDEPGAGAVPHPAGPHPARSGPDGGETYFRALVENASDLIMVVTAAGIIRYVNRAVERVLGYGPGERIGRSTFEWIHPEDAPLFIGAFTRLVRGIDPESALECRVQHRDGPWRVLEMTVTNLMGETELQGVVLNARDVTDRRQAEDARRQLAAILDATPDLVCTTNPHGHLLYANRALRRALGVQEDEELRGRSLLDLFPTWATERVLVEGIPAATRDGVWTGELALVDARGEEIPVSLVFLAHRSTSGAVEFISTSARDIREGKQAEAALRESEARFRQVAENIEEVFWLVDCTEWRLLYVSPAFESVWGRSLAHLSDDPRSLLAGIPEEDRAEAGLDGPLEEVFLGIPEREYRIVRPDGEVRWIRSRIFPVRDPSGAVYRVAGISEDITRRKQSEAQLLHVAMHDGLTGLPNRAAFMARLRKALEREEINPRSACTVLFVDLDGFKLINDSLGHLRGDELLVAISRRLEECVRPEDMVARLGGDEFVVLLHSTSRVPDAARVAERILSRLGEKFDLSGHEVFTSASIGIVPSLGYELPEDLLRDADIAMYRAKLAGRGAYQVFDAAMHNQVVTRLRLEMDLRQAMKRGEFRLHYQPIVSLTSGRITGFEALVRWEHPTHGLIPPADFIAVAEETGLIVPLGWWVLREACRQMQAWSETHPEFRSLSVSINLSGKQLAQRDLLASVVGILRETGMDPRRVNLEITESVIVDHSQAASAAFARLKELGLRLQIDDFGTGYSSLSYLHRFPVDTLKIDRSFVGRIASGGEGGEIARTVAALGHNLGMGVVAEGVETAEQMELLRELGCQHAQGYFLSPPLEPAAAERLVLCAPCW
ncbi:MAG TPA: EAL domain-containing protein [Longimicrobiaceae bacterium]|nr:EAL domain-containing protein [Longimicrobiaceae bacterium]